MKQLLFLLVLFLSSDLVAQTIGADVTAGCPPLRVNFTIQPPSARDTITTIQWDFGSWRGPSADLSPSVTFNDLGTYSVSCLINGVTTLTGTDLVSITECSDTLDPPNVFSPNEDGINDFFMVKTNGISTYSFSVFTRSGTLVYKTESPAIIWDGRSLSGHKMKNGIYFYTIRQLDSGALNEVKGIVYLFE